MAPLRARFLGGSSFGALMAADGVVGGGSTETVAAPPAQSTQSESAGPAAAAPADSAAGTSPPGAPAAAAAPDQSAAPAAPEGTAPAKPESAPSLIAEAKAKPPGDAEAAKPDAQPEAKPADKPAPAEPKKDEAPPAKDAAKPEGEAAPAKEAPAEKPPAQTYEAFKVPDGISLDAEKTKSFTSILDNPEFKPQDRAQALVDLHLAEVTRIQKETEKHQQDVWKTFQQSQRDEFRADAEVGGNRMETALGRAKWVIEQYGGDAEQQRQLLADLSYTGMGNNVRLTRLLNNVADLLSEGEVVPAAPIAAKTQQSRREKFYPTMQQGNGKV